MSLFDERAEGAAQRRRRDGGNRIPPADVRALKTALGTQHRKLEDDLSSVDVLLHTDPSNPNAPVEQGPPLPGTPSAARAADFIGRVADDIRKVRNAVFNIDIDQKDKRILVTGLFHLASAWDFRAQAVEATDPVKAAAAFKKAHEDEGDAAAARKILEKYFPDASEEEGES